jgi:hypothetical protein
MLYWLVYLAKSLSKKELSQVWYCLIFLLFLNQRTWAFAANCHVRFGGVEALLPCSSGWHFGNGRCMGLPRSCLAVGGC